MRLSNLKTRTKPMKPSKGNFFFEHECLCHHLIQQKTQIGMTVMWLTIGSSESALIQEKTKNHTSTIKEEEAKAMNPVLIRIAIPSTVFSHRRTPQILPMPPQTLHRVIFHLTQKISSCTSINCLVLPKIAQSLFL